MTQEQAQYATVEQLVRHLRFAYRLRSDFSRVYVCIEGETPVESFILACKLPKPFDRVTTPLETFKPTHGLLQKLVRGYGFEITTKEAVFKNFLNRTGSL